MSAANTAIGGGGFHNVAMAVGDYDREIFELFQER
jgi:hypothetical protein